MPVETVFRNIEFAADEPLGEWRFPFENFFPRRAPDQFACLAPPEFGRLPDRLSIHSPILRQAFDSGRFRKTFRWFENALLDEMRFDVVVHGQSLICRRNSQGKRSVLFLVATSLCDVRLESTPICQVEEPATGPVA